MCKVPESSCDLTTTITTTTTVQHM